MTEKIKVTAQQRANAIDARDNMWPSVPLENVSRNLSWWSGERYTVLRAREDKTNRQPDCGTVACFGGWCAWWPNFRDQGVRASPTGAPYVKSKRTGEFTDIADHFLFGCDGIFALRGGMRCDVGFSGDDHQLVTNRINWLIENSEVIQ